MRRGEGCTSNVRLAKITNGPGGGVQLDLFFAIVAAGRKGVMTEAFGKSLSERTERERKKTAVLHSFPGPVVSIARNGELGIFFFSFQQRREGVGQGEE